MDSVAARVVFRRLSSCYVRTDERDLSNWQVIVDIRCERPPKNCSILPEETRDRVKGSSRWCIYFFTKFFVVGTPPSPTAFRKKGSVFRRQIESDGVSNSVRRFRRSN